MLEKMNSILDQISQGQVPQKTFGQPENRKAFEEPVFIPKDIIPHEAEATVNVSSVESDRPDINEAASALKALKKSKKSKVQEGE
jgi:hypothetical protein